MLNKTIRRIERILLNDVVDRCTVATKFVVGGGAIVYTGWRTLDYTRCGAGLAASIMFAVLSTLLGLTVFAIVTTPDDPDGG